MQKNLKNSSKITKTVNLGKFHMQTYISLELARFFGSNYTSSNKVQGKLYITNTNDTNNTTNDVWDYLMEHHSTTLTNTNTGEQKKGGYLHLLIEEIVKVSEKYWLIKIFLLSAGQPETISCPAFLILRGLKGQSSLPLWVGIASLRSQITF